MTTRLVRRLRNLGWLFVGASGSALAIDSATVTTSALSPDCLTYRVVGICYWLFCSIYSCEVRTSVKVSHYVPDAVVSSYNNTGQNPWTDVAFMSPTSSGARHGSDGSTSERHENNLSKFKNADVIGHPATIIFSQFAQSSGYSCEGVGQLFSPYLLSVFDTVAWRHYLPEMFYPEALIPGRREIASVGSLDTWGSVYPRGGFLHQSDDYKAAAVVAQRAGDVVTRRWQPHVYRPLLPLNPINTGGYWPAGPLVEGDASTGKWQELVPSLSSTCAVFPNSAFHSESTDGGYAWALWRPYSCCRREGQIFLFSIDFNGGISR
jgi:integrating conjugative element protein (TIGR03756 family)